MDVCPQCNSPIAPFDLLEDDPRFGVLFSGAKIENGLEPHGLRCSGKNRHEYGFIGERRVEIDCRLSEKYIDPPNPSFKERVANGFAKFIFRWLNWAPLSQNSWAFLRDLILIPWQVGETWYVVYDPEEPPISPEDEAQMLADAECDAQFDRDHDTHFTNEEEYDPNVFEFGGDEEDNPEEE